MPTVALPFQLTKTLACSLYEMQAISNVSPVYLPDTTINSKYNNNPTLLPSSPPKISYFGIGVNGFKNLNDQNLSAPFVPSAKNLDLYKPLPFRVVPVANDLSDADRAKYRMRVMQTIDGQQYWCYYLKKLSFIDNRVNIISTNLTTGVETVLSDFDPLDLNPTPQNTSAEGVTETDTKVSTSLSVSIQITGVEVIEAINVLYGGNLLKAVISEIGVYTGNDQDVTMSDGSGGSFTGTESIFTSLAYHYTSLGKSFSTPVSVENLLLRLGSANAFLI
jgi:hypothetical protein